MKIALAVAVFAGLILAAHAQPVVSSPPTNLTVNAGSAAYFAVIAADPASNSMAYQWTNAQGTIPGATNATLALDNISTNQAGVYGVVVSSASGTANASATLTVLQGTIVNLQFSGFASGPSNVLVELFDHDKPATVENFIHYIQSGAYSNLIVDRLIPGFVLQSGDYDAPDRTNSAAIASPNSLTNIATTFVQNTNLVPPFPQQLVSEFYVGPIVSNTAGTLAVALPAGNVNGGSSAFFINLVSNPSLDSAVSGGGPFTVFGRVIQGAPVLSYFDNSSAFAKPNGGIFDYQSLFTNDTGALTDLPVNFDGTQTPSDANLFFLDFSFPNPTAQPVVDTTPPTATITFPAANLLVTNGYDLAAQGTAADNVAVAQVSYSLNPQNGAYNGNAVSGSANGTGNWTQDFGQVPPGIYNLVVTPQDAAGNWGSPVEVDNLIVTAVLTNGAGTTVATNTLTGAVATNAVGAALLNGIAYGLGAIPAANQLFVNWSVPGTSSISPDIGFTMQSDLVLTATFIANTIPDAIAFTSPALNGSVTNGNFLIQGTIGGTATPPVTITALVYGTNSFAIGSPIQTTGTTTWSLAETNSLAFGQYTLQIMAQDANGNTTLITNQIRILNGAPPVITASPTNLTVNAGSSAYFTVEANNAITYQWTNALGEIPGATNPTYAIDNVATNQAGAYGVIVNSPGGTVTASATLTVLQGTVVNLTISGFASGSSNVVVELFDHDKPATVQNFLHYIRSGSYSNLFIDRLLPGFVLQTGDYDASDRTNSVSPPATINIYNTYVQPAQLTPPLPYQVDSEYYATTIVSNTAGTVAMALPSGNVDGANNAFFFNLVDNPSLDSGVTGGGPFTVFARVISGTPVLNYFNDTNNFFKPAVPTNLVFDSNIFDEGIFDLVYVDTNASAFGDLPVNFHGTNIPADNNLFFVDFSFPDPSAPPVIATNPPTAIITFPSAGALLTNGIDLVMQGTAHDNVGLARVYANLYPKNGGYSSLPLNGDAQGTTQWSYDFGVVEPGIYNAVVTPQNGAGYLGQNAENDSIIVTAVVTNGLGTVTLTNASTGAASPNAVGAYLATGTEYEVGAHPGPNQIFVSWSIPGFSSISPQVNFTMEQNLVLIATFLPNTLPHGIAFTSPAQNGSVTNGNFLIQGTISGAASPPVTMTCQVFTANRLATGSPIQTTGTNSWSMAETNLLAPGEYILQVIAKDAKGNSTLTTNPIVVLTGLALATTGPGTVVLTPTPAKDIQPVGNYLVAGQQYTLTAKPGKGAAFYSWSDGVNTTLNPVKTFTMAQGMTLTASFVSNNVVSALKIITPAASALLTSGLNFQLAGTVSSALVPTQIMCQLFLNSNAITGPIAATNLSGHWTAATQTNLAPGRFYTARVTATDAQGRGTLVSENFSVLAQLTVATNSFVPAARAVGSVSPADNGKFFQTGSSISLTAKPNAGYLFAYWTIDGTTNYYNPLIFSLTTNETVTANYSSNYYLNVSGTYDGLFYPTNGPLTATNVGYFTMTVTTAGFATLDLVLPHHSFIIEGELPYTGSIPLAQTTSAVPGYYLGFGFSLDLTNGTDVCNGFVYNYDTQWYAPLTAYRVATNLSRNTAVIPTNYVLSLPGNPTAAASQPGGNSYATYTISPKGVVTLTGSLADGTAISQSTGVSKAGVWPLFLPLYANSTGYQGVALGWQTNYNLATSPPATNAGILAAWSKPAKIGSYYTAGFNVTTNTIILNYTPPVAQTTYQITFGGGTLANSMTNLLTTSAAGLLVPLGSTNTAGATDKLSITLAKTGALSGQFINPASKKTVTFKGAFIGPAQGGSGYFLDTDGQSGYFQITATP